MKYLIKEEENKHLLILVHGLKGSNKTWEGENERFVENLKETELLQDYFDLALFTYGTSIFKINWIAKVINLIKGFFNNSPKENAKKFNLGIDKASMPLVGEINIIHNKYDSISFISHSMGGLITKNALTWLDKDVLKKIYFFMSLSVPHIGAPLANLVRKPLSLLFGKNPQIRDLKAMGDFTTNLNARFSNKNPQPRIVYQWGNHDDVVPRQSAVPPGIPTDQTVPTSDNHFSVVLIKDRNNNYLYQKIIEELNTVTLPFLAIDTGVPKGVSFKSFIEGILLSDRFEGITIGFQGFTESELNYKLREGNIQSKSLFDFLIKVSKLSINKLPKYLIYRERGTYNFIIKVNQHEYRM